MNEPPKSIGVEFRMKDFGRVHPQAGYIGDATDDPRSDNGDVEYIRADLAHAGQAFEISAQIGVDLQYSVCECGAVNRRDSMTNETGILADLNLKAGDKVELIAWEDGSDYDIGKIYTMYDRHPIQEWETGPCVVRDRDGYLELSTTTATFRVVSRASPVKFGDMPIVEQQALQLAFYRDGKPIDVFVCDRWHKVSRTPRWEPFFAYRVRPPKPETVTLYWRAGCYAETFRRELDTHSITYTIDPATGKPDTASVKMEEIKEPTT